MSKLQELYEAREKSMSPHGFNISVRMAWTWQQTRLHQHPDVRKLHLSLFAIARKRKKQKGGLTKG